MATNCPDDIFVASLAVMGGRAEERTTACPCLAASVAALLARAASVPIDVTNAGSVASDREALLVDSNGSTATLPLIADTGGSTPNETSAQQERGGRTKGREGREGRQGKTGSGCRGVK